MSRKIAFVVIGLFVLALVSSIVTSRRVIVGLGEEYIDTEHGFSIRHPKVWAVKPGLEGSAVVIISPREHASDMFQEIVAVNVGKLEPGRTLDELVEEKFYKIERPDPGVVLEDFAQKQGESFGTIDPALLDKVAQDEAYSELMAKWMARTVLVDEPADLGLMDARRIVCKARSGGHVFQYLHYYVVKGDRYFVLSCVTETLYYEKYEGVFEKMCRSFHVD